MFVKCTKTILFNTLRVVHVIRVHIKFQKKKRLYKKLTKIVPSRLRLNVNFSEFQRAPNSH